MTTVVVTSTLVLLASDSWTKGTPFSLFNRRAAAVLVLLAGAVVGAVLLEFVHISVAMASAALLTLVVACIGHRRLGRVVEN